VILRTNRPRNHPPFVIVDPGDCQRLFRRPSRRAPRLAPRGTAQHCRTVPQRRLNVSDRLPGSLADSTPESILAPLPGTFRPRSEGGASGFDSQSIAANDCPNGPATLPQRFWPGFRGAYPTRIPNRFPQRCRERFDRSRGEPPDSIPIDCRQRLPERSRNIASNVSDRLPGSLSDSNPESIPATLPGTFRPAIRSFRDYYDISKNGCFLPLQLAWRLRGSISVLQQTTVS